MKTGLLQKKRIKELPGKILAYWRLLNFLAVIKNHPQISGLKFLPFGLLFWEIDSRFNSSIYDLFKDCLSILEFESLYDHIICE
jgi:hypothetical protein